MSSGSSGKITVFLILVQSQQPALCASNHVSSKQEGKVLSRHHCLRRTSSELFCLLFWISRGLVSVTFPCALAATASQGSSLHNSPSYSVPPAQEFHHGTAGATAFLQKTLSLCHLLLHLLAAPPHSSRSSPNDAPPWIKASSSSSQTHSLLLALAGL